MVEFNYLDTHTTVNEEQLTAWIISISTELFDDIASITYTLCSDDALLKLNQEHLDHDYYTDILTFDLRDNVSEPLICDIYISVDRINDNATQFNTNFADELKRVLVHGLLHLAGYDDHNEEDIKKMRDAENYFLSK